MKTTQIIQTGDTPPSASTAMQADFILSEMGQLYRERFQALTRFDHAAIKMLGDRIDALRSKLARL